MKIEWDRIEPGWYTSKIGGIADESAGKWYYYPYGHDGMFGPYKTLGEAKIAAEAIAKQSA